METKVLAIDFDRSPVGVTLGANSRFLVRDGKPWLPVMGEFHFSRYPAEHWEDEILKMKAGGVQIVSTYVFWNHHEEVRGSFDWSGERNLRRFVELCGKHGLLVWVRVGPWSHGEARYGGFPDWLVRDVGAGLRSNDSTYLASVGRYYGQIGAQLRGLLWQDGGPIIGVQLENEYTARGSGRGPDHILRLKALARAAGLTVPFYSVTGWDGATFPPGEVIPVFGGYPEAPWDASIGRLPPNEVYAFRFANRVAGNMGAQGAFDRSSETSSEALARYPFIGAEFAGGIQVTYHRRPTIATDDIAAMLPVQIGSGVNLYGYYMFHGGTNPRGKLTTLQESQRTGYPTDVPVRSYDFQAPLSEFGEMRESFQRVKLVHYFLTAFGDLLAPMVVRPPEVRPATPADTSVPRLAARTWGDHGFIFFNNYVRDYHLPARKNTQVALRFPHETVVVPDAPVDIPSGAYFIWPVNFDMNGVLLKYATAQLLTRVREGDSPVYFFYAVPGITPEFAFDAATVATLDAPRARIARVAGRLLVSRVRPGTDVAITVRRTDGSGARIVVLTRDQAQHGWRTTIAGHDALVLSPHDVFVDGERMHLRTRGGPRFTLATFPSLGEAPHPGETLQATRRNGIFHGYKATLPPTTVRVDVEAVRGAAPVPPVQRINTVSWRKDSVALAPTDSAFGRAAEWRVRLSMRGRTVVTNVFLQVRYQGDVARLYAGDTLVDDDFFRGTPWRVGLTPVAGAWRALPLSLRVLPLRGDAPIYLSPQRRPTQAVDSQLAELLGVDAIPEYELIVGLSGRATARSGRPATGSARGSPDASTRDVSGPAARRRR